MDLLDNVTQRLGSLNRLYENQRDTAWENARQKVAGKSITDADFEQITLPPKPPSQYPPQLVALVVALCLVVLIAAFIPSAMRLYIGGTEVFCDGIQSFTNDTPETWCKITGLSTVVLSEIGQTIALLSIAVLGTSVDKMATDVELEKSTKISNRIFWGIAGITTMIAYIGNLHVAKPWLHSGEFFGVFAWILDLAPPTLVIGVMYSLKELMLYFIRQRHLYRRLVSEMETDRLKRIEHARYIRQQSLDKPEDHPQWLRYYSLAIRDAIRQANKRQKGERRDSKDLQARVATLDSLTHEEWKYLIKREMVAARFTVNPDEDTEIEIQQRELEEELEYKEKTEAPDEETEIWINEDETYTVKCNQCGKVLGTQYKQHVHGLRALNNHHRYHARQNTKGG